MGVPTHFCLGPGLVACGVRVCGDRLVLWSMGSLFAMPFYYASEEEFLSWKSGSGLPMLAASMNGKHPHHDAPYDDASIIIMGNEQSGLPAHVEEACDTLVRIPMREGADSLNLATATALMVYAAWGSRGYAQ